MDEHLRKQSTKPLASNHSTPLHNHTTPSSGGIRRGRVQVAPVVSGETMSWEERRPDAFAFARRLEGQHIGFAVVAYIAVECSGRKPTRENVLARLKETGRTVEQLREKGWIK